MSVCPDCRSPLSGSVCSCGWAVRLHDGIADYLGTKDRTSPETADYINTYDTLAEKNLVDPTLGNEYVSILARRFAETLGDVRGKDFCDLGAGRGYLIKHVLAKGPKSVTAVDIAAPALKSVSKAFGVPCILANAEHLPFERNFDIIAATDILEHVLNVSNFLMTANWSLRDDGVLAIRVPYLENMTGYSNYNGLPMHFTHLRTFDRKTLVWLIEPFGFKVERVHYDGFRHRQMRRFYDRFPKLKDKISAAIRSRFPSDDAVTGIHPLLGRLLMHPVEIGVTARKTMHIRATHYYEALEKFYNDRKSKRAI